MGFFPTQPRTSASGVIPAEAGVVVVDASLAVKWLAVEPDTEAANRLQDGWRQARSRVLAPNLLLTEVANALWQKVERRLLSPEDPVIHRPPVEWFPLEFVDDRGLLQDALDLALTHHLSVYDAVYVALAVRERAPLYTADAALRQRVPHSVARLCGIE